MALHAAGTQYNLDLRLSRYDPDSQLAAKACHQLGMIADLEFIENWWTFPSHGKMPILWDNIWCEEMEPHIADCRHDGLYQNVNMTCPPLNVVGLRCIEPKWAGIRYTLLANPPSTTLQEYIHHVIIEKAGMMDYYTPIFSPALQIDWNYHTFNDLIVRDNFWTGIDIVYNDLVKKPKIERCTLTGNRRHGLRSRTYGLTLMRCNISSNQNAGIRYNPILSRKQQQDVVTWLERTDISKNQVVAIPAKGLHEIHLGQSSDDSRKFLVAKMNREYCSPGTLCTFTVNIFSDKSNSKIGISVIDRPDPDGDENVAIEDGHGHTLNLRKDLIKFPHVSNGNKVTITYTRKRGEANLKLLVFYQDVYDYLTPFIHVGYSEIGRNQYAVSTMHYSDFDHADGSIIIRYEQEQLWFQKSDFVANKQAVIWVNGPIRDARPGSPIAEVEYYIDNCSIALNNGSIIETHRDLYQSANVFHWRVWRTNFIQNYNSGIDIRLPDTYDRYSKKIHNFIFTENLIRHNRNFKIEIGGFYAWMNVSANNVTFNIGRPNGGLFKVYGMEKYLVMERNRFESNKGKFVYLHDTQSLSPNFTTVARIPASIRHNLFWENFYVHGQRLVDHYPRSFTIGIRGVQSVDVNFNDFYNDFLDFEAVVGLQGAYFSHGHKMNLTYNYWGRGLGVEVAQRIFDFNDWNIYSLAEFSPFFLNAERPWRWEWQPSFAQTDTYASGQPSVYDLQGMLLTNLELRRNRVKWSTYPYNYKPDIPYIITKDLTVMPGVTLTIDPGVEIHVGPGVRILVLGTLKANGTYKAPIRFRPINVTEMAQSGGRLFEPSLKPINSTDQRTRRIRRDSQDEIYQEFSLLHRQDTYFQKFKSFLVGGSKGDPRSGFLEIYNATTNQMVPICDRQFTRRNAEVVCRELGYETYGNAYYWVGPRYDYNPRILITRYYSEPRQCYGNEARLSDCHLRVLGNRNFWWCSDIEHFVFVHCGKPNYINEKYIGAWGGITVATYNLEHSTNVQKEKSSLRFVEIVGAGRSHNSTDGASLEVMFQNIDLSHVNVTNGSMHAINIIGSPGSVILEKVNVTHNRGKGVSILSVNALSDRSGSDPLKNLTIPYNLYGAVGICSASKLINVQQRVMLYFKYDNFPVDCYKIFRSTSGRKLGLRFIQLNLYSFQDEIGRIDTIEFYNSVRFNRSTMILAIDHSTKYNGELISGPRDSDTLAVYLRANAAGPQHGFLAEVVTLPASPDNANQESVKIIASRFQSNDRGGVTYSSIGEKNPNLLVDQCYFESNGYHLFGNFTTSTAALRLVLQNTLSMRLTNSMLWRNMGGLDVEAGSTTSIARLAGLIKNVAFSQNRYYEALRLVGRNYQEISILSSYFGKNYVPYRDVVLVDKLISNFSHNVFYNNTGTHIVDITGYTQVRTDVQGFYHNFLSDNIAHGHGYQFNQSYGYIPPEPSPFDNFRAKRFKRSTSFEWWAHVGTDTKRYKSTIWAGSNQQRYESNYMVNPDNDFELTTVTKNQYGQSTPLKAENNWWGSPGTDSVASGRIRDQEDYPVLIAVDYKPVLRSNASLLDNGCPPGWFFAGQEKPARLKSCFLFVGGALPYHAASEFCIANDGFMPYFQASDPRIDQIASKLRTITDRTAASARVTMHMRDFDEPSPIVWVSGVMVPPQQCGYLSISNGEVGYYNCEGMLPFICEKGPGVHAPWFWLSKTGILAIVISILTILLIVVILLCWLIKSRRRKREFFQRKNSLRDSLRSNKLEQQKNNSLNNLTPIKQPPRPVSPDIISSAHARLVLGTSVDSLAMHKGSTISNSDNSIGTSHSMLTDGRANSTYDFRPDPKKYQGSTDSESAYVTQTTDGKPGSGYFYSTDSSGTALNYIQKTPPRPQAELITLRSPTKNPQNDHESRSSLSTFRRSDLSDMDASSCSCTVTDNSSVLSDRASSNATLTPQPSASNSASRLAMPGTSPFRPNRPPPPPPHGAKSTEHLSDYPGANRYAQQASQASQHHAFDSPLRKPPSGATPTRSSQQRPVSTQQFVEPYAYPNMAYAASPSYDSLTYANQNSVFARGTPSMSSFGKSKDDRSEKSLPLETAM